MHKKKFLSGWTDTTMRKTMIFFWLLSLPLFAADILDLSFGMTKEEVVRDYLMADAEHLTVVDDHQMVLGVEHSERYGKYYLKGAIAAIRFFFDQEERLYRVRLESDGANRSQYLNYEYLMTRLLDKINDQNTTGMIADAYEIAEEVEGERQVTYYLDTFNFPMKQAYEKVVGPALAN